MGRREDVDMSDMIEMFAESLFSEKGSILFARLWRAAAYTAGFVGFVGSFLKYVSDNVFMGIFVIFICFFITIYIEKKIITNRW